MKNNLASSMRAAKSGVAPRLFVYGRFSSLKQEKGDSFKRQMDYAHRWAEANGYEVDTALTMFDQGLSAYKGEHVRKGALGVFLAAIREKGLVRPGDVLLVESLDRLSRAEPVDAQRQFSEIIDSGVMIVTANNDQRYSRELLKRDPSPLFLALATMIRANEESETKSKRARGALRRQCEGWATGWRGRLNAGSDPGWARYNETSRRFEIDPDQAFRMRTLFDLWREGYGPGRAFTLMRERGIPLPRQVSDTFRLYAIISNRNLVGEKIVTIEGNVAEGTETKTFVLQNYYPPLLTEAEFASLQYLRSQRGRRATKGDIPGIMTGIGIAFCAHCGYAMAAQNILPSVRNDVKGSPMRDGARRIICSGWKKADGPCPAGSTSIVPVERALMKFCSDQMNLSSLFMDCDAKSRTLNEMLALARQSVTGAEAKIAKYMEAAASDDGETPASMLTFIRKLEAQLGAAKMKVTEYEHDLESLQRQSMPAVAHVWAELREGVEALDPEARMKTRQLVGDTFKKIEVAMADRSRIGIRFISKHDIKVIIWLDRKTGEYLADPVFEPVVLEDRAHAALDQLPARGATH